MFTFDPRLQRYRNQKTGRIVSVETVRGLVSTQIKNKQEKANLYTSDLISGKISLGDWESLMAGDLKILAIQFYKLGKPDLSQSDYGRLGFLVKRQFSRLRKLSNDIQLGTQSEKQIYNRTRKFFNKSREAFEDAFNRSNQSANARWERRITNKAVKNCSPCLSYEALGWQPLGTLPNPTEQCDCRDECKCKKEYSFSITKPTTNNSIIQRKMGWI